MELFMNKIFNMDEIIKQINDTNASYRQLSAGDAKNTDLFLDNEHYALFEDSEEQIEVRFYKDNLTQAILFISSILPRKYDHSATHKVVNFSKDFVLDQLNILDAVFSLDNNPVNTITQIWKIRKNVPKSNGEIDERFYFNGLLKNIQYTNSSGAQLDAKFTIRNYLAGGYSKLHIIKCEDGIFDVKVENVIIPHNDDNVDRIDEVIKVPLSGLNLQQIFYGAPGTGKSYQIKENIGNSSHFRTTFHPDSDYSSFVGSYKPTSTKVPMYTSLGDKAIELVDKNGAVMLETKIIYDFVAQAFLEAYTAAWKSYPKKQYLIIEEINRGNCAQIFGDLFQLLDRNNNGFSDYPIQADNDIRQYIQRQLSNCEFGDYDISAINTIYAEEYENIIEKIFSGEVLVLPSNLSIWATMNTSDQSLFPIDSAFKRRWDWRYIPISNAQKNWNISVNGSKYDWWSFLEKINDKIGSTTDSEDKKIGYFFVKAEDEESISANKFVSKVIFYLWNDVFKDYGFDDSLFKNGADILTFQSFFNSDGNANESNVELLLNNLGVEKIIVDAASEALEDSYESDLTGTENNFGRDYTKYSINNVGQYGKNKLAAECVTEYIKLHPNMTASEVLNEWLSLGNIVPHFIESRAQYEERTDNSKRSREILCGTDVIYVATDGYVNNGNTQALVDAINTKNWGIHIDEV